MPILDSLRAISSAYRFAAAVATALAFILLAPQAKAGYVVPEAQANVLFAPSDGQCSLWEAIDSLNNGLVGDGQGLHGCVNQWGGNDIELRGTTSVHFQLGQGTSIARDIVIWSSTPQTSYIEGIATLFDIFPDVGFEVYGIFLQHIGTASGRVIMNRGNLMLYESTVANGNAVGWPGNQNGGGIYNAGSLHLLRSTVRNNRAVKGGGIYNTDTRGGSTIDHSTVSSNTSTQEGGGIYSVARLQILNSTISSNTAGLQGGGIYNHRDNPLYVELTGSTVAFNVASAPNGAVAGGGVYTPDRRGVTKHSIVARNRRPSGTADDFVGHPHGDLFNESQVAVQKSLFGTKNGIPTGAVGRVTDLEGDPRLNGLTFNGGPTKTHALQSTSPAIGANDTCPSIDQRGMPRPSSDCDIGAYEFQN